MTQKIFIALLGGCASTHWASGNLVTQINPLNRPLIATETGENLISPTDMQLLIDESGDRLRGGVFDCEAGTAGTMENVEPDYNLAGMTIGGITRYGRSDPGGVNNNAFTSGGKFGFVATSATWTLTTREEGDLVTHFSTIFSQWGAGTDLNTVTATFTDNTTKTFTANTPYQAGTTNYLFVGFQAPAGLGIRSITISEFNGGNWIGFDDIAFVINGRSIEPFTSEGSITAIRRTSTAAEIDYEGAPGLVYALDFSPDLQVWDVEVANNLSGSGTVSDDLATRLGAVPRTGYYRLRRIPPAN